MTDRPAQLQLTAQELDRMNLEQALRDFEVANARVLDLTQRLIESEQRRREVETELEAVRQQARTINSNGNSAPVVEHRPAEATVFAKRVARWTMRRASKVAQRFLRPQP